MSGIEGLVKISELRKRVIFTLIMLAVYRIGVHIPVPGIDGAALQQVFANMQGTIFGWFNLFSGGAWSDSASSLSASCPTSAARSLRSF